VCACGINCLTLDVRDSASMLYRIVWVLLYLGDYGLHLHTRDVDIMTLSAQKPNGTVFARTRGL
jgi:hypothetical protein